MRLRRFAFLVALVPLVWAGRTRAADGAYSVSGPEPMLASVFQDIEKDHLDRAFTQVQALIRAYPTFRLAQMIKGDLLLARARPLTTIGDATNVPEDKLLGLREEAIARIKWYRDKPPADSVPGYLLQMEPQQKYAIVVDTQKSRLFLYKNVDGQPHFVADYYVTHGKAGTNKTREGDGKTPIGVYHVTARLPKKDLADIYGDTAFPLNYPNAWDRRMGRNGHGIWLHGTPSNTFSRPPLASDGCVVLSNQDLDAVAKDVQIGLTPVIISNSIKWLSLADWRAQRKTLQQSIDAWRRDWESRNTNRYLSHYSKRFLSGKTDYAQWAAEKQRIDAHKQWIKVATRNVSMFRNPGKTQLVVVTFDQEYRSNNYDNEMRKVQYWIKEDGAWKIIYEGAA